MIWMRKPEKTSKDNIAGNGRVPKLYLFIVWLYLFKEIYRQSPVFSKIPLQGNGMAANPKMQFQNNK